MSRSAPHSSKGPTTSAAATAAPDPEIREPGFFRRWLIDPLRYFWLGITAPTTKRGQQAAASSSGPTKPRDPELSASATRVVQRCQRAPLLDDRPCDLDLLLALLDEEELEPLWVAASTDIASLRADVEAAAAEIDEETLRSSPQLRYLLQGAIMHVMGVGGTAVDARALLVRLWAISTDDATDPLLELLAEHGLTLSVVTTFFSHGVIAHDEWSEATAPAGALLAVELVNDDYSPQELVTRILREVVALSSTEAHATMLSVHRTGRAAATVLPRAEAIAMANMILAEARGARAPLKATLSPIGNVE